MAYLRSKGVERPIEEELPQVCHFLKTPLELKDEIYKMLLTTQYCASMGPTGTTLEFQLCTNILLANKQIHAEATRVFFKKNHFVILKISGLSRDLLEDVPKFGFITEDQIVNPVLRAGLDFTGNGRLNHGTVTLITAPQGLQAFVAALWRLKLVGFYIQNRYSVKPASLWCSLTLDFNVKASIHREALRSILLEPWERVHGLKELTLVGNIEDPIRQRRQRRMLEGPFPAEAAFTLTEYHTMALEEMAAEDLIAAQWWLSLYEGYSRYLTRLNNQLWSQMWDQSAKIYFKERLEIAKTYLQQENYNEIVLATMRKRSESVVSLQSHQTVSRLLKAKLSLCEALAYTWLGDTKKCEHCLKLAADSFYPSAFGITTAMSFPLLRLLFEDLKLATNKELIKLNSPYRCRETPTLRTEARKDYPAGLKTRSFWEWLDLPEQ